MQLRIRGFVDYTHAPTTELFQDAVVRYGLADHKRRTRNLARILGPKGQFSQTDRRRGQWCKSDFGLLGIGKEVAE